MRKFLYLSTFAGAALLASPSFAQESLQVTDNRQPRIYGEIGTVNSVQIPQRSNVRRIVEPVPERIGAPITYHSVGETTEEVVPTTQRPKPVYVSPEEYQRLVNEEQERIRAYNNRMRNRPYQPQWAVTPTQPQPYQELQLYEAPNTTTAPVEYVEGWSHVVKKGDTLYSLAKHYKIDVQDIRSANGLRDNTLSIDQILLIPSKTASASYMNMGINQPYYEINPSTQTRPMQNTQPLYANQPNYEGRTNYGPVTVITDATGQQRLAVQADTQVPRGAVYAVLPKDTLYGISRQSCVPIQDIIAQNRLTNPNALKPGQRLNLPAGHCLPR